MRQEVWMVYILENDVEYDEMDAVYDICLTESAAIKSMKEGEKEFPNDTFWIEKSIAHD